MKKLSFLAIMGLLCSIFVGCGNSNSLSNFSKRKYLKKQPHKLHEPERYLASQKENQILYASSEAVIEEPESNVPSAIDIPKEEVLLPNDSTDYQDTIITKTGDVWNCKITSAKDNKINYHFNPQDGKKIRRYIDLSKVKYHTHAYIKPDNSFNDERVTNGFATLSFLCVVPGALLILPLFIAPIFGIIALVQINKEPEKYKGEGLAIVGMILSILLLILIGSMMIAMTGSIFG